MDEISHIYRIKFMKTKESRYLSHLDMTRVMQRAITRSGLKLKYSHGYNPKPRLSFSNPAPLGIDSKAEYCDMVLEKDQNPDILLESLNAELPSGLSTIDIKKIVKKTPSLMASISLIEYMAVFGISASKKETWLEKRKAILGLEADPRFSGSIFGIEDASSGEKDNFILKIFGYAKILEVIDNKIFKFNYFLDCLKDLVGKEEIDLFRIYKEECFILIGKKLFTPIEVLYL